MYTCIEQISKNIVGNDSEALNSPWRGPGSNDAIVTICCPDLGF